MHIIIQLYSGLSSSSRVKVCRGQGHGDRLGQDGARPEGDPGQAAGGRGGGDQSKEVPGVVRVQQQEGDHLQGRIHLRRVCGGRQGLVSGRLRRTPCPQQGEIRRKARLPYLW